MSEFEDQLRTDLKARIAELEGRAREHEELTGALAALNGAHTARHRAAPQLGRRPGSGTGRLADEAVDAIRSYPGLQTKQVAERMGIQVNYLYRLLPDLEQAGRIERLSGGWYTTRQPAEAS